MQIKAQIAKPNNESATCRWLIKDRQSLKQQKTTCEVRLWAIYVTLVAFSSSTRLSLHNFIFIYKKESPLIFHDWFSFGLLSLSHTKKGKTLWGRSSLSSRSSHSVWFFPPFWFQSFTERRFSCNFYYGFDGFDSDERIEESKNIIAKYPDRIPVRFHLWLFVFYFSLWVLLFF